MIRVRFGPKRGGVIVEMTDEEAKRLWEYLSRRLSASQGARLGLNHQEKPQDPYAVSVAQAALAVEAARKAGKQ